MAQNGLLDFLQGASNSAASTVSAPIDGLAWLLRKAGAKVGDNPIGGSDWMRANGLTQEPQNKLMGLLGEAAGGVAPMVAGAYAPQIAKGLLGMADNAMAPRTLNKQAGKVFAYPQDAALATAQRNAALPVEQGGLGLHPQNTPMERAQAMGFVDEGLLHGTPNDFPAFHVTRQSVYATNEPEIADIYATAGQRHKSFNVLNADPNVMPLVSRGKRMEISDVRDGSHGWYPDNLRDALGADKTRGLIKELPNYGYDSIQIKNMTDLGGVQDQYVFPNPNVLRSRFAAFDPKRINENDLLGRADTNLLSILAGGGVLGLGAYSNLKEQQ